MKRTCPESWILVTAFATASCAGRYQVGTEPGAGGASGAAGSQVTTGPAVTSTGSGSTGSGGSTMTGSGGQGGAAQDAGPASRCGFSPDGVVSSTPTASAMLILSRIVRLLDDSSNVPPGMLPSQPTADWAGAQAMAILDGHLATGTEAAGLAQFLAVWLHTPAGTGLPAAHTWSVRLLDPNATLATLLAGSTGDPRRNGILTDQQVLAAPRPSPRAARGCQRTSGARRSPPRPRTFRSVPRSRAPRAASSSRAT